MTNLTIDIGNTRLKVGIFKEDKLLSYWIWEEANWDILKAQIKLHDIQHVIVSTVRQDDSALTHFLKQNSTSFLQLDHTTPLPVKNCYETPKTLGKDRLAGVVGAQGLFPNQNCLVIDAGTCITYDLLDKKGDYLGGNITPGVNLRLKAMNHFTQKLPLVSTDYTDETWVGTSTETALRAGAQLGTVAEMEGLINRYQTQMEGINVILTGGDADYFGTQLKSKIFVNPHLVLLGLNKILHYNVQ